MTGENKAGQIYGMEPNTYCMLLHLSQLLGLVVPVLGLAVPIVMWAIAKDNYQVVDRHGRIVLNWIICELIYVLAAALLCIVVIGFVLLPAIGVLAIVFPVIGAVKANKGETWSYPLCIKFF